MMKYCLLVLLAFSTSAYGQVIGNLSAGIESFTSGENRMKVNDWNGAVLDYSNAISADPSYAEAYYKRSVAYTKLGRFKEAINDQNEALRLNPGILKIYDERAKLRMLVEDYPGAVADFTKAIELTPIAQPSLLCQQAHAQLAAEDFAGAVSTFNGIIQQNPRDTLSYVFRALAYLNLDELEKAGNDIDMAIRLNPKNSLAYEAQGLRYLEMKKYDEAIASFTKVININPQFALAWHNRGIAYKLKGENDRADKDFTKAISLDQNLKSTYFSRALIRKRMGETEESLKDYNNALALDKDYTQALFYRGTVKKTLGDYQGAMNDYDESIRINPNDAQAFNNRGNVRMLFGDYSLAVQDYDQAIRLKDNYGIAYFNRGIAKLMLLKRDSACDDFKQSEQYGYEAAAETIRDFARSSVNWILFLLLSIGLNATAQQKKILWIGNSYIATNNLPLVFYNLAISGGDTVQYDSNTPGGATLQNHATSAVTQQKISSQPWDYVVVQAQSQEPSFPPNQVQTQTLPFATDLDSMIRANNSCSETVFYMTWGRKYGDQTNCPNYPPLCTFEGMTNRLRSSYKLMADQNQGIVAPVGPAWKNSWFADSTINLWVSDNSHPSPSGTYLTACVFYSTFFRKSPVGFPYTAGLSQDVAAYLQEVAWNTVNDSLETWNIGRWDPQAGFNYSIDEASVDFNQTSLYSTSNLWNFGDGNTSPLVNPTHTYNAPGNYTVSLIVSGCGKSDTLTEPISITATAIAENVKDINWRIFPNPSTRDVMIQAEDVTTFKIEVYGPDGKLAKRKSETGRLIKLDFSDLPAGIYQVYCYGNGSSRIFRLMKE